MLLAAQTETFLFLTATGWNAVGTFTLALVAYWQLSAARSEAKKSRTLTACERYDFDPVLDQARRNLIDVVNTGEFKEFPKPFESDVYTILNYLEQLAIGAKKGVYNKQIIEDYLKEIAVEHVRDLIESDVARKLDVDDNTFSEIKRLCEIWANPPQPANFRQRIKLAWKNVTSAWRILRTGLE